MIINIILLYLTIGFVWAEMGRRGHKAKFKEEVSDGFYFFMMIAWPYLVFTVLMDNLFSGGDDPDGHA